MSPEPPLDATGIARRQFSTVRRGYDPHEVRAFLNELSALVGRLQREEAHEHERAQRAENRAELAERLDEHRLVELLGEETARVLEAAREASSDIRVKAEESAARMIREAQAEAHAVSEQAERDAAARRAELVGEVEALRHEATDELDRRRVEGQILVDDMRRAAEAERDQMLADGERARSEAESAAEQIRAAARDQGRRLVGEAHAVRERILADLARRRRSTREQLERLNGARVRLLAAYEVVRRTVDEATTELTVALPEARMASEAAVQRVRDEPEESVDVLEAELSVARMSGAIDEAAATVSDDELDAMLRELAEEEAAQAARREAEARTTVGDAGPPPGPAGSEAVKGAADVTGPASDGEPQPAPATGGPGAPGAPDTGGPAATPVGSAGDAGDLGDAARGPQPAAVPPSGGTDDPAPASATPPAPGPAPASPAAPQPPGPERPQSDAERWGVRLPSSRRGRRGARPTPAASTGPAGATATMAARPAAGPTATATVDAPAPASGETPVAPGPDAAPPAGAQPADEGETGPYVDELFARIRAERRGEAPAVAGADGAIAVAEGAADPDDGVAGERAAGAAPGPEVETADTVGTSVGEAGAAGAVAAEAAVTEATAAAVAAGDDAGPDATEVDPATWALRTRDEALGPLERDMGRRLKRILTDEQNEVLDTLRRGGTVEFADVLPAGDEHADRYAIAIGADLDEAAAHGAEAAGGTSSTSCDPLAGELGRALVQPLRRRIERTIDESEGDVEEVTERLRSLYREWKGQRIGAAVRHYSAAAYSVGMADALPAGTPQRWIVDPSSCAACPDCDDNALAGEVAGGDAFATGDRRPPAHPDCRCLVVAAASVQPVRAV